MERVRSWFLRTLPVQPDSSYEQSHVTLGAMAVTSLRYDPGATIEENRSGNYIYDGSASRFHEWSFRAGMRVRCSKEEDLRKTMSMIVEALRGEAAQVAMDLGLDELREADGFQKLEFAIQKMAFPQAHAEAKDLYRAGHKQGGVLARQTGEPMTNFISRRRRWWRLLKQLDSTLELSEGIRGDLLLASSRLKKPRCS